MIAAIDNLTDIRNHHKNQKIVLTSGTFDLFHVGHLNYLNQVKGYGDIVVVLLSGDFRVRLRKGANRPIIPENDRAKILDALKAVDYVLIDRSEKDPAEEIDPVYADIISKLYFDLYVTDGEDIRFSKLLDKSQIIIVTRAEGGEHSSTSTIIEHIKKIG